jgi:hypothetical protein
MLRSILGFLRVNTEKSASKQSASFKIHGRDVPSMGS